MVSNTSNQWYLLNESYFKALFYIYCPDSSDLLQRTEALVLNRANDYMPLPAGKISIRRLVNANIEEPSSKSIHGDSSLIETCILEIIPGLIPALSFHSSANVLMAAGEDKHARFYKIDGEKNEKKLSKSFERTHPSAF